MFEFTGTAKCIQLFNPVEEEVGPQKQILVLNLEEDNKTLHPVQNNELPPLADNFLLWMDKYKNRIAAQRTWSRIN